MDQLTRLNALGLGAALGLAIATAAPAWSWSSAGSIARTPAFGDPHGVWDDEIDGIIERVIRNGRVASVNEAMASWVNNRDAIPVGLPDELRGYLASHVALPEWADMDKLRRAADFNRRRDVYLFMLCGVGGGIMSTTIPREAKSVYWSKGGGDMKDRAAKTFTFGYDLVERNAFEPDGQFLVTANKTRMVHAAVRHLLPQSPHWSAVADEPNKIPISNADILVTFHSLGTYAHRKLNEWGVPFPAEDQDAFLHSWQVAISMLGVQDRFIPRTWEDCYAQSNQVLTPILAATPEGNHLAEDLLGLLAQLDFGLTRGLLNEFARYFLSNQIGDWLGLPRDYLAAETVRLGWPAFIAFKEGLNPVMPDAFYLFDQVLRGIAMLFLNEGSSHTTTPIELPDMNRPS